MGLPGYLSHANVYVLPDGHVAAGIYEREQSVIVNRREFVSIHIEPFDVSGACLPIGPAVILRAKQLWRVERVLLGYLLEVE